MTRFQEWQQAWDDIKSLSPAPGYRPCPTCWSRVMRGKEIEHDAWHQAQDDKIEQAIDAYDRDLAASIEEDLRYGSSGG